VANFEDMHGRKIGGVAQSFLVWLFAKLLERTSLPLAQQKS